MLAGARMMEAAPYACTGGEAVCDGRPACGVVLLCHLPHKQAGSVTCYSALFPLHRLENQ